jgi:tight adherence protein B
MQIEALLAAACVMGAIVCAAMAFFGMSASPRDALDRRLGGVIGDQNGQTQQALASEVMRTRKTIFPTLAAYLDRKNITASIQMELDRADMRFSVSEFVALRVFLGLIGIALGVVMVGAGPAGLGVGLVLGTIGYKAPAVKMHMAQGGRVKKINEQLLQALTMLSSSLKAGFGIMQGMDICARDLAHPLSTEFRRTIQDINVGSTLEEALKAFSVRCGSADVDIVVTAMLIQQSTGGNLSEILDNVNETMRERIRIRGEIKTLTTQQSMSGWVIGGLPLVLCLMIFLMNPSYLTPLYKDVIGLGLLAVAGFLEFVGVMVIKKILAIEV